MTLGLYERPVDDAEFPVRDAHLGAGGERHQPAIVEHTAGLSVGEFVHRLHKRRARGPTVGRFDDEHKVHVRSSSGASRGRHRR